MKIFAIACIDCRHSGKLSEQLASHFGCSPTDIYITRVGGGFGNLASLKGDRTSSILKDIDLAIRKAGVTKIIGTIHQTSDADSHGCAAYIDEGYGKEFETVEGSQKFVHTELEAGVKFLTDWLVEKGYTNVTVEVLPVSFGPAKENILG